MTIAQVRGPKFNLFKRCTTDTPQTREKNSQEMLQRMQALRAKTIMLRKQCEEIIATINIRPPETSTCAKCGRPTKNSRAAIFMVESEQKMLCKKCFAELLK